MKQICVTTGIFPPDIGGPATFARQFTDWLSSQGIASNIVSLTNRKSYGFRENLCNVKLISRKQLLPFRFITTIWNLSKYSRTHIYLVNGLFLEIAILGMFRNIDYAVKVPGDIVWERARNQRETTLSVELYQGQESWKKKIMRYFFTRCLQKSRHVIVPNTTLKGLAIKWGVDNSMISIVSNGAKDIFFDNLNLINEPKKYDLITVGRLMPIKGLEELLKIAKKLNLSLAIVGSGPDEERLKKVREEIQVEAYFLGELRNEEVVSKLKESKYFIINSEHEGSPHALIEALALGMACFARSNSGTREILDGRNGFLYDSFETLQQYIYKISSDNIFLQKVTREARRYAESNFRQKNTFIKVFDLLK